MYGYIQNNFLFEGKLQSFSYAKYFQELQEIQRKLTTQGQTHLVNISGQYRSRKYWGYAMNKYSLNKELQKENAMEIARIEEEKKQLFRAYEIIQHMREMITGQTLTYRLYATDPKNNDKLGFITIDGDKNKLSDFIKFSDKELSISQSKVLTAIKNSDQSSRDLKAADVLYKRITTEKMHIVQGDNSKMNYKGTFYQFNDSSLSQRKYTRGHIIEEIDKLIFNGSTSNMPLAGDTDSFINTTLQDFNKISIDSVLGFKGGDNEMVQIKANSARLMRYTSIMYAMDQVLEIGYRMNNDYAATQRDVIAEQLHQLFSDRGKNEGNELKNQVVNKFVSDFEKIWQE